MASGGDNLPEYFIFWTVYGSAILENMSKFDRSGTW
jgi:hypothetical protein